MYKTDTEPQIALEISFERYESFSPQTLVTALCGYVEEIEQNVNGNEKYNNSVKFLDSSVEFASGWVNNMSTDMDVHRSSNWKRRKFISRPTEEFISEIDSTKERAGLMIIGTSAVESFFEDLVDKEQDTTTSLMVNATTLAINRLRRSVTSLDPSPAALADIRYYLRTKANKVWEKENPEEYNDCLRESWDLIGWHYDLQTK